MKRNVSLRQQQVGVDHVLFILPIVLTMLGLLAVADASAVQAQNLVGDKFFFARQQLMWAGVGILGFLVATKIPSRLWEKVAIPFFIFNVLLLIIVLLPGIGHKALGAQRWIDIAGFNFQPGELIKLSMILFISKYLTKYQNILPLLFIIAAVCGILIVQPDLGTGVIVGAVSFAMLFIAGAPITFFFVIAPVIIGALFLLISLSEYRRVRFMSFVNGVFDPLAGSYHVKQTILAIASGGLFGVGLGQSRQKFLFLPEAATDSIFAVIAEEVGLFGSIILVALFAVLVARIFQISNLVENEFGKLVVAGVGVWVGVQTFINLGAMTALIPLTGVPLPLFSYGGSSLIVTLTALGVAASISRERRAKKR
ncbi:putative lipid II flippase FtsW [Candidatus Microgenomates bacterium]|nr:putative lipid II flippase FtsW [Candidatus Microgenomates bacterium]